MAQRQFRSDDTDKWLYGFGNGSDGAYSSVGNATDAPVDSSCSGTSGTTSLSATNASFASGQLILIHQTRGTGAGNWELNKISSYTAGTITTTHDLMNTYTDSGDSQAQVIQLKQYSSFTQNSGHTLTAKAWNGNVGGIIAFLCSGDTTITGTLTSTAKGYLGGTQRGVSPHTGEGNLYNNSTSNTYNTGNSGGGSHEDQAGAGGGFGTAGSNAGLCIGGSVSGSASLITMTMGGGGGSGCAGAGAGSGGNGGGGVIIITKDITISGHIYSNGTNGGSGGSGRGGGGGSGGSILIKSQTATLGTSLITSSASSGGSGGEGTGGAGGVGRIHLDYKDSYSGTTTPTINVTQDDTLNPTVTSSGNPAFFTGGGLTIL